MLSYSYTLHSAVQSYIWQLVSVTQPAPRNRHVNHDTLLAIVQLHPYIIFVQYSNTLYIILNMLSYSYTLHTSILHLAACVCYSVALLW